MLVERNKVYTLNLHQIKALYHSLLDSYILEGKGSIPLPFTFLEDLDTVVNFLSGTITIHRYHDYISQTVNEYLDTYERSTFLDVFCSELFKYYQYIPDITKSTWPVQGIYVQYDDELGLMYIVDRRKDVSIPPPPIPFFIT